MYRTAYLKHIKRDVFIIIKPFLLLILFLQFYSFLSAQSSAKPKLAIQLLLNTNEGPQNTADGVVAFYADIYSASVGNEDAYKWTNLDENLAINCKGRLLSIDGRPTVKGTDTLNLVMWQFRQKSYYLQLLANNFSRSVKAVVKDKFLHKETVVDLSSATLLPFTITSDSASFAASRFSVIFKTKRPLPRESTVKFSSVFKEHLSISVSPNPVTGNTISLQFNNMKKGRYAVNLYSKSGEKVYSGFIAHRGGSAAQSVEINKRIHGGMYKLQLGLRAEVINRDVLFQ